MPFKTSVTFTYDCGEFEKNMDLALDAADKRGFEDAAQSKRNGKLRGLGFSNTIERSAAAGLEGAEIRFDRTGTCRSFPAASTRARVTRRHSSRSYATGSASIRTRSPTSKVIPTRCSFRRHRRVAFGRFFRLSLHPGCREDRDQGQSHRGAHAQGRYCRCQLRRRHFFARRATGP